MRKVLIGLMSYLQPEPFHLVFGLWDKIGAVDLRANRSVLRDDRLDQRILIS